MAHEVKTAPVIPKQYPPQIFGKSSYNEAPQEVETSYRSNGLAEVRNELIDFVHQETGILRVTQRHEIEELRRDVQRFKSNMRLCMWTIFFVLVAWRLHQ